MELWSDVLIHTFLEILKERFISAHGLRELQSHHGGTYDNGGMAYDMI